MSDGLREAAVRLLDVWDDDPDPKHPIAPLLLFLRLALLSDVDDRDERLGAVLAVLTTDQHLLSSCTEVGNGQWIVTAKGRDKVKAAEAMAGYVIEQVGKAETVRPEMAEHCSTESE
jgi:hypothetical protein